MQHVPWADKYGDVDNIHVEEWLNHCKKCFNEWVKSGVENRNKLQKSLVKVARGDRKSLEKV